MLDYSKLQNGSDIRGVALAGDEEVNLGERRGRQAFGGFCRVAFRKTEKADQVVLRSQ